MVILRVARIGHLGSPPTAGRRHPRPGMAALLALSLAWREARACSCLVLLETGLSGLARVSWSAGSRPQP